MAQAASTGATRRRFGRGLRGSSAVPPGSATQAPSVAGSRSLRRSGGGTPGHSRSPRGLTALPGRRAIRASGEGRTASACGSGMAQAGASGSAGASTGVWTGAAEGGGEIAGDGGGGALGGSGSHATRAGSGGSKSLAGTGSGAAMRRQGGCGAGSGAGWGRGGGTGARVSGTAAAGIGRATCSEGDQVVMSENAVVPGRGGVAGTRPLCRSIAAGWRSNTTGSPVTSTGGVMPRLPRHGGPTRIGAHVVPRHAGGVPERSARRQGGGRGDGLVGGRGFAANTRFPPV